MNGQRGRTTFMSLVAIAVLLIGGFMAFRYIGTGLAKKQIKKEVFDMLGTTRGNDRSAEQLTAMIEEILLKKEVEVLDVAVDLEGGKGMIYYSFSYRITANYLFFKRGETVEVVSEIANYE
jgi:hypothetical protein